MYQRLCYICGGERKKGVHDNARGGSGTDGEDASDLICLAGRTERKRRKVG